MLSASGIDERHEAKDLHGCWTALERPPSQVGDVRLNEPVELVHELHRILVGRPSRAASHRWALFPFALQKKGKKARHESAEVGRRVNKTTNRQVSETPTRGREFGGVPVASGRRGRSTEGEGMMARI